MRTHLGIQKSKYAPSSVVTISRTAAIVDAAKVLGEHDIGCLVVTDTAGRAVGIISERDIIAKVIAAGDDPARRVVGDIMSTEVVACGEGTPIEQICKAMTSAGIRHLPVVRDGVPVEMISSREIMAHQHAEDRAVRNLTIFAMAKLAESRDPETGEHLERVCAYSRALAFELAKCRKHAGRIDEDFLSLIHSTSPLHDIGKVGIPDRVLLKPGRLAPDEFEIMKEHSAKGAKTLELALQRYPSADFLRMARDIAASHHERVDGKGYPQGLSGEDIPLSARIFAVADVYDALVSKRVYKAAMPHDVARDIIAEGRGAQFDTSVVDAFLGSDDSFATIFAHQREPCLVN